jgi:hypothetical protein
MSEKTGRDWSSPTGAGDLALRINDYYRRKYGVDAGARPVMVAASGRLKKEAVAIYGIKSAVVVHAVPPTNGAGK